MSQTILTIQRFGARATILAAFLVLAFVASPASAECCKRKADFGCCGNGACNIFCCNCDGGCNRQCENTHCDTGQWVECGAVVTACATACAVTDGEACAQCMGSLYDACKGCVAGSSATTSEAEKRADRDEMFRAVASVDGDPKSISKLDFHYWVENEKQRSGRTRTTAPVDEMFRAYDTDSSGGIDRKEMDNEDVGHGLVPNS